MKTSLQVKVRKAAVWAVVINSLQILSALALVVYAVFFSKPLPRGAQIALLLVLTCIIIWGAAVDIREAVNAGDLSTSVSGLNETVEQMSDLNRALRTQRHDFLNHLQVVYSLMEMEEYDDAREYIKKVYGEVRSLSTSLRTACVPVNALMRVKLAECRDRGIECTLQVRGSWEALPIPGWEMCRVLGNLMDNAIDALKDTKNSSIHVLLGEDIDRYYFQVTNNGPRIPEAMLPALFDAGVSTKGEGRGMGLYISRKIMQEGGGELTVTSLPDHTCFSGFLRREPAREQQA